MKKIGGIEGPDLYRRSSGCECDDGLVPGACYPAGDYDLPEVQRCDSCARFPDDGAAAEAVAAVLSLFVGPGYVVQDEGANGDDGDGRWFGFHAISHGSVALTWPKVRAACAEVRRNRLGQPVRYLVVTDDGEVLYEGVVRETAWETGTEHLHRDGVAPHVFRNGIQVSGQREE